ncbi:MAG: threonine-phosphate decarboxylase CobD [Desulfobacca sp.]|uniref:threonine-phosphate decarboxylase CobD n=1 Tax=Desulfobacca sp. TaxID=2067990 RepID=UPI0040495200
MALSDTARPRHGGDVTLAKNVFGRDEISDFSANMNPLGPPAGVWQALLENLQHIVHYPDPYARELRAVLAAHLGIEPANLVLGNGSMELLYLLPRLWRQDRALLPAPGFSEYEYGVRLAGLPIQFVQLKPPAYTWDLTELCQAVAQGGLIFLCNPNNPTGTLLSREALEEVLAALPETALLVMDEAFIDFVDNYQTLTLVPRAVQDPRLLVLGSLTKFYALPGLRLGYVAGTAERVQQLAAQVPPWNINSLAQAAGIAALQDKKYLAHSREYIRKTRQKLYEALQTVPGLQPLPPSANFIFCRLGPELPNAPRLVELMGQRGFLLRDCSNYRGLDDRGIRLAVRRQRENEALVAAFKEVASHGV